MYYQSANLLHSDEIPILDIKINDIDEKIFINFYENEESFAE